eukprot:5636695-Amphidinium_carterae.1
MLSHSLRSCSESRPSIKQRTNSALSTISMIHQAPSEEAFTDITSSCKHAEIVDEHSPLKTSA